MVSAYISSVWIPVEVRQRWWVLLYYAVFLHRSNKISGEISCKHALKRLKFVYSIRSTERWRNVFVFLKCIYSKKCIRIMYVFWITQRLFSEIIKPFHFGLEFCFICLFFVFFLTPHFQVIHVCMVFFDIQRWMCCVNTSLCARFQSCEFVISRVVSPSSVNEATGRERALSVI